MGNEILNENEDKDQDKEPLDYQNDYIRYGVISKKCGEKALEDIGMGLFCRYRMLHYYAGDG